MGTALVHAEIDRFLRSSEPEVLCIKGKWGVGKTYAWGTYLREVSRKKALGTKKYSYVSLFGLNSLEALRYSIFENVISEGQIEGGPSFDSLENAFESALHYGRKGKPLLSIVLKKLGLDGVNDPVYRALFFSVRNQIVCIDDLERAGVGLALRDVLGLCSMLKEQRGCKVVLLLNDEELENSAEFDKLLEKVVDTSLVFSPTPLEAAAIALVGDDYVAESLRERVVALGIENIRVIKKIERFARRLEQILSGFREEVLRTAISTCVLGGWAVMVPKAAPPLQFIRRFNRDVESVRQQREGGDRNPQFTDLLTTYGYTLSDNLDVAILDGVAAGFFDVPRILEAARENQAELEREGKVNSFQAAWDRYHGSLKDEDDVVLDGLFKSAQENFAIISPTSINATVGLLRQQGRDAQASQLVREYLAVRNFAPGVIEREFLVWGDGPIDSELEYGLKAIDEAYVDERDPREVLCAISADQGWNEADIALLAKQSPERYVEIFEGIEGRALSAAAKFAVRMGGHEGENYKAMSAAAVEGLRRIAAKSPLRARRVASYGVKLD